MEYTFGGALIRSALPLPSLTAARNSDSKIPVISVLPSDRALGGEVVFQWPEPATVILERSQDGWVYRLPSQQLAIGVDRSGETVRLEYPPDSPDLAGEFLVRRVLPRLLEIHGRLLIHGATLAIAGGAEAEGGAIALVGKSRVGKSTLATALCRRGGFQLMGDDTVVLERDETGWLVHTAVRDECLWPDSAAAFGDERDAAPVADDVQKVRRPAPGLPVHGTRRLRGIYLLDTAAAPRIDILSKYDALRHGIRHMVRFNPRDAEAEAARLARLHAFIQEVPVARLAYPRAFERLDDVCDVLTREHA